MWYTHRIMLWDDAVPKSGWKPESVVDMGRNSVNHCHWCGTRIRYIHTISHEAYPTSTECGCICAEKLTGDPTHRKLENELRSRSSKKTNFAKSRKWRIGLSGNLFITKDRVTVKIQEVGDLYKIEVLKGVHRIPGRKTYGTVKEAKEAAFDAIEWSKFRL